jgi:hypothetical protein
MVRSNALPSSRGVVHVGGGNYDDGAYILLLIGTVVSLLVVMDRRSDVEGFGSEAPPQPQLTIRRQDGAQCTATFSRSLEVHQTCHTTHSLLQIPSATVSSRPTTTTLAMILTASPLRSHIRHTTRTLHHTRTRSHSRLAQWVQLQKTKDSIHFSPLQSERPCSYCGIPYSRVWCMLGLQATCACGDMTFMATCGPR